MSTSTAHGSTNGGAPARALQGPGSLAQMAGRMIGAIAQEAQRRVPDRRPRRARPRLHPRDAARGSGCSRASTSARRCAASRTSRRRARCCSWATTPAATSRPTRTSSRWRSAPTSASSAASTSSPTTWCCRCPGLGMLRKYGTVAATPENAAARARRGRRAARLPGRRLRGAPAHAGSRTRSTSAAAGASSGWRRSARCRSCRSWRSAGQETALFLSRGERLAKLFGLDRMFRLKVLPISLALPWVLNVGDMLGHIPLPGEDHDPGARADRRVAHGRGQGLRARDDADADRAHRPRRGALAPGARLMRVERDIAIDALARARSGSSISDPDNYDGFWHGITPARAQEQDRTGSGARFTIRMRIGSADIGGLVEIVECDENADMAWTSITGIDHRVRWRLREADDGRTQGDPAAVVGLARRPARKRGRPARRADGRDDARGNPEESGPRAG